MSRKLPRFQRRRPPGSPGHRAQVPGAVVPLPRTKPTKALVAALITVAGLVGVRLTSGTAELILMACQLILVAYGVWRTRNNPKDPPPGGGGIGWYVP